MLSSLRAMAATYLTDTCTIDKQEKVSGTMADRRPVWRRVATDTACRVIRAGQGGLADVGAQEALAEEYKVSLPVDTEIGVDYRVTVAGVDYYVTKVQTALTVGFFTQVIAVRRR